jgi:type II secretory pathway pseudopilin PulG
MNRDVLMVFKFAHASMKILMKKRALQHGKIVSSKQGGFTLIETIVVLAIIILLVGILLSAVQMTRAAAARSQCLSHMRQLSLAMQNFCGTHGALPPGHTAASEPRSKQHRGWIPHLLPHLEQEALLRASDAAFAIEPDFRLAPHPGGTILRFLSCSLDSRCLRTVYGTKRRRMPKLVLL